MYGHAEMTRSCVRFCKKNAGIDHDILVVDDGSLESYIGYDGEFVHQLSENSGYTNATNQGILWCGDRYDYIHLLNNDTEPEPGFLKILYDFLESNSVVGIAASVRILQTDSPHNVELYGADLIRGFQMMTDGNIPEDPIYCHWIPVCSALIRYKMVRYIGLLDRRMRTWSSDLDYCLRANAYGWNVALLPKSRVKHIHQVTTGKDIEEGVKADQKILLEKLSGIYYAEVMKQLPLDAENRVYGKLDFSTYKKKEKEAPGV